MPGQRGQRLQPVPERRESADAGRHARSVTAAAIALAIAAGIAGAVQAAVMGELGGRAGVFPALAFSGVVSVVLGLTRLLIGTRPLRGWGDVAREPLWLWTGGALS